MLKEHSSRVAYSYGLHLGLLKTRGISSLGDTLTHPYLFCQVIEDGMAKKKGGGEGEATNHTRHCLLLACIAIADMGFRPSGKGCLFAMS
jgi:hypothetical protein